MKAEETIILIVDDNQTNVGLLLKFFDRTDFETLFALDGQTALQFAENEQPHLILLDIMMPGMDGFEVCRRLKENDKTKEIPVIFTTALSDIDAIVTGFSLGAVDYITKPYKCEEVMLRVKAHLSIQESKRELQQSLERERKVNQLKSCFLPMASHGIRNPLTIISRTSDLLRHSADQISNEVKAAHLNRIQEAARQGTETLEEILNVGKDEAGMMKFEPRVMNPEVLCHEIVEEFKTITRDTYTISFACEGKYDLFRADESLLRHILSHLLSNAIGCSPAGSTVHFELMREDGRVIFQVESGKRGGRLFRAFRRGANADQKNKAIQRLSVVEQFVDLHDGKMTGEGDIANGMTFTIAIPDPSA